MKKCPKCGKVYDDTWKVCLSCTLSLIEATQKDWEEHCSKQKIKIDKKSLATARISLKKAFIFYISTFALFLVSIFMIGSASKNPTLESIAIVLLVLAVLSMIVVKIIVLIKLGAVQRLLGGDAGDVYLLQAVLFFAMGDIIVSILALRDSKKALEAKE